MKVKKTAYILLYSILLVSCKQVQQSPNGYIHLDYVEDPTGTSSFVVSYTAEMRTDKRSLPFPRLA